MNPEVSNTHPFEPIDCETAGQAKRAIDEDLYPLIGKLEKEIPRLKAIDKTLGELVEIALEQVELQRQRLDRAAHVVRELMGRVEQLESERESV